MIDLKIYNGMIFKPGSSQVERIQEEPGGRELPVQNEKIGTQGSPQVNGKLIVIIESLMYKYPHKLPKNLRLKILENDNISGKS